MSAFLFGNALDLANVIANGRLDYYLSLPRPVLLHVLASRSITSGLGDFTYGVLKFPGRAAVRARHHCALRPCHHFCDDDLHYVYDARPIARVLDRERGADQPASIERADYIFDLSDDVV